MHFWQRLLKPEYLYHPTQLLRRLGRPSSSPVQRLVLPLPWGLEIEVSTGDAIGRAIWQLGVYDLTVSEVLWRLTDPGETCLDVGANLGYMTSLLCVRAGHSGQVHSFEPHPEIHGELARNAGRWRNTPGTATLILHAIGLSHEPGTAALVEPPQFEGNRGTSSLAGGATPPAPGGRQFQIEIRRLDDCLPPGTQAGVTKVDVEGHELGVFSGATRLLRDRALRDIVYEDNDGYPGRVSSLLESAGYEIRRIDRRWNRPQLLPPAARPSEDWLPSSFLASRDPKRAEARMRPSGWQALTGPLTGRSRP